MFLQTSHVLQHVTQIATDDSSVAIFVTHVATNNSSVATNELSIATCDTNVATYVCDILIITYCIKRRVKKIWNMPFFGSF